MLDITKKVKLKYPGEGEEDLVFTVVNYNSVTQKCNILPVGDIPHLSIIPTELVSVCHIENVKE